MDLLKKIRAKILGNNSSFDVLPGMQSATGDPMLLIRTQTLLDPRHWPDGSGQARPHRAYYCNRRSNGDIWEAQMCDPVMAEFGHNEYDDVNYYEPDEKRYRTSRLNNRRLRYQ